MRRETGVGPRADRSRSAAEAWSRSGLLHLTGPADGPGLGPPLSLVEGVTGWAARLDADAAALGRPIRTDPMALLAERAALVGLHRGGRVSCGGGARLLPARDGWVAVSLVREDDWALTAAWLGLGRPAGEGAWDTVAGAVADRTADELREGAALLGLPVAVLGERQARGPSPVRRDGDPGAVHGIATRRVRPSPEASSCSDLLVVELAALWAGPLVGRLLGQCGARVVKVESWQRPDGARAGARRFFDRLNAGKESVALDFASGDDRSRLARLVSAADVVVTGSRPRALAQLDLDLKRLVTIGRPRVWLSITGYGTRGASGRRVAFGDDAAVAGGLVSWDDGGRPCFCADAVADPVTGLAATAAVLTALRQGGAWLLDASMADVAGGLAGPTLPAADLPDVAPFDPDLGQPTPEARQLGADTGAVLGSVSGT